MRVGGSGDGVGGGGGVMRSSFVTLGGIALMKHLKSICWFVAPSKDFINFVRRSKE